MFIVVFEGALFYQNEAQRRLNPGPSGPYVGMGGDIEGGTLEETILYTIYYIL